MILVFEASYAVLASVVQTATTKSVGALRKALCCTDMIIMLEIYEIDPEVPWLACRK